MIIEQIISFKDLILQHQPYFHQGFADVKLIEYADRNGLFVEDAVGEHEYAMPLDYNSFYLRRIGNIRTTGYVSTGISLEVQLRLVAQASNVDKYKMLECLTSVILTECNSTSVNNIELSTERILRTEGVSVETIKTILSRVKSKQFIQIDFNFTEIFNPTDLNNCDCNPCKNC